MHEFEQLEDAVIAQLESLKAVGLRTLEPYAGQIEVDELEEITFRFPCIYVIAPGLTNVVANSVDECRLELTLIVGDRHLRGAVQAARGDVASPGVYDLLQSARKVLHRTRIINGWTPLYLKSEAALAYMPLDGICLYTAGYETKSMRNL